MFPVSVLKTDVSLRSGFGNLLPDVSFVSFSLRVAPVSRGLLVGVPGVADLGAELFAV